ncbi:LysR family transcriptional regulator [Rhizobium sp. S-51]|uniref:LysR family transcriptional regulator n=1 Tax=Rhizobium terricola TaxID=2728849 RepID=A0A7Y0AYE8_9HYPH|nr:LysR family transcriptional regulator [Rhizobium terricola]NML75677.1 LysR family transcriptional regulator [Rhizobium terricola]
MPIFTTAARCLVEVIDAGSIRRAAEILNTAPSAVNRQILNLEAEYRTTFLERLPRGVRATTAGRLMADQIRKWQGDMEKVADELARLRGAERHQVTIGMMECFAGSFFAEVLDEVRRSHPEASVIARVGGTRELVNLLEDGEIDLIIGFNIPPSSNYWVMETIPVAMGVATAANHRLAGRKSLSPAEIESEPLLLVDDTLSLRPFVDSIMPNASSWSNAPLTSNSIAMIRTVVGSGAGISILTRLDVRDELAAGRIILVPLDAANTRENLSICVRDQTAVPALITAFTQAMIAAIRRDLAA